MKPLLIIPVLFFAAFNAVSQDTFDETKMIGFACFYEGRETKIVSQFGKMLKRKRYTAIGNELRSKNPAARVMAVFCLERLAAINKRSTTPEENLLIDQIKISTEPVDVCSGCFPSPGMPIEKAFTTEILWGVKPWLEAHAKE
jgi:hypothetical protein